MNRQPVMTVETSRILGSMSTEQRNRVLERAAIIKDGCPGPTWIEADERALAEEQHQGGRR